MIKPMITEEDKTLFRRQMQGVVPIKESKQVVKCTQNRNQVKQTDIYNDNYPKIKCKKSMRKLSVKSNYFDDEFVHIKPVSQDKILRYAKGNIGSTRAFYQLKHAKISIDATLDLHERTLVEAKRLLARFLDKHQNDYCLKIIHGKGLHNSGSSVLKSYVAMYLKKHPNIAAYHSCSKTSGGTGALLVLVNIL